MVVNDRTGLGRELALAALARGDKVIATARSKSVSKLADLKTQGADVLELDVTDPIDQLHEFAKRAVQLHGRVDVLVNNAGQSTPFAGHPPPTLAQSMTQVTWMSRRWRNTRKCLVHTAHHRNLMSSQP